MIADARAIKEILALYGFKGQITDMTPYIDYVGEDGKVKLVLSVTLDTGHRLVVKILCEGEGLLKEREIIERQSAFSEFMRKSGISTPKRYTFQEKYCVEYQFGEILCNVTVEDYCGKEIKAISEPIAYEIGKLMAKMHNISLAKGVRTGCKTLFSAAHENDVDIFERFCQICNDENLDRDLIEKIKSLREEKVSSFSAVWENLPMAAVQGDMSINNLVLSDGGLTVFDYNNAGDVALVSDFILEGLLTAYEMEFQEGIEACCLKEMDERKSLFFEFTKGYLSERKLSDIETRVAWEIYTLYNGLWFTKIVYAEGSLESLVAKGDYDSANHLLEKILQEMTEENDGRFSSI